MTPGADWHPAHGKHLWQGFPFGAGAPGYVKTKQVVDQPLKAADALAGRPCRFSKIVLPKAQYCCGTTWSRLNGASPCPQDGQRSRSRHACGKLDTRVAKVHRRRNSGVLSLRRQFGQNCNQHACAFGVPALWGRAHSNNRRREKGSGWSVTPASFSGASVLWSSSRRRLASGRCRSNCAD